MLLFSNFNLRKFGHCLIIIFKSLPFNLFAFNSNYIQKFITIFLTISSSFNLGKFCNELNPTLFNDKRNKEEYFSMTD